MGVGNDDIISALEVSLLSGGGGGAGADKLVTEEGNTEGGGEDDDNALIVVCFDVNSFKLDDVDEDESKSAMTFVAAVVDDDLDLLAGVEGVEEITPDKGGALKYIEKRLIPMKKQSMYWMVMKKY